MCDVCADFHDLLLSCKRFFYLTSVRFAFPIVETNDSSEATVDTPGRARGFDFVCYRLAG